jgi:hypothetical protein
VGSGQIGMMRDMLMSFEMGFLVGLGVVWGLRGSSGCDFGVWFLVEKCFGNAWILAFFGGSSSELEFFMAFWGYLNFHTRRR